MTQQSKPFALNRRAFVASIISMPVVAIAGEATTSSIACSANTFASPVNLASASNMNMFQNWTWFFNIEQAADGTFALISNQVHDDPCDEPWEIEPETGLRSGHDIYQALDSVVSLVDAGMTLERVESAIQVLAAIDSRLADDFLVEASEGGFDQIPLRSVAAD